MTEKQMIECTVCLNEIEPLDKFNGEPMCQECYHAEENHVFGDDVNG